MKLDKKFFIKCSQGLVNLYNGQYGEVKEIYKTANPFCFQAHGLIQHSTEGIWTIESGIGHLDIKGTDDDWDWLSNFIPQKKSIPYPGVNPKIKVRQGFLDGYKVMREWFLGLFKNCRDLVITGHSRGAPIAALAAVDYQWHYDKSPIVMIEGCPRFANKYFMDSYFRRVPQTFPFRKGLDICTFVPLKVVGYEDFKIIYDIGKKAYPWPNTRDHYPQDYLSALEGLPESFYGKGS